MVIIAKGNLQKSANGSALKFEAYLWAVANKLCGHIDASEYKYVFLGLKGGGEFYTLQSVVRVFVVMLEPFKGRVIETLQWANTSCSNRRTNRHRTRSVGGKMCISTCGPGGMFEQSEKLVRKHGGRIGDTVERIRAEGNCAENRK